MTPTANPCCNLDVRLVEARTADELICLLANRFDVGLSAISALQTQLPQRRTY